MTAGALAMMLATAPITTARRTDNDRETDRGGHGSGDDRERSDHNQGQGGPAAPSEPGLAAVAAQVVTFTIVEGRVVGRA